LSDTTHFNIEYYNTLYKQRNVIISWLHGKLSFDQQCKNGPNLAAVEPILQLIIQQKRKALILDYGCGRGLLLLGLSKYKTEPYCYDISENAMINLEAIMSMFKRDVKRISFDSKGRIVPRDFDIIVCSHVLEHVDDDLSLIQNLVASLRPGGYLLVNVPINEGWPDPRHVRAYVPEALKKMLRDLGLAIEEERQVGKLEYVLATQYLGKEICRVRKMFLRCVSGLFALFPYKMVLWIEKRFLSNVQYCQLILIGKNP
jgi:2-polyprenyl-3-methyl-5-hydroxy-6-metoxy-1,4-benzoquinol methylase